MDNDRRDISQLEALLEKPHKSIKVRRDVWDNGQLEISLISKSQQWASVHFTFSSEGDLIDIEVWGD
jgi:hypothetical protein